MQRRIRRPSLSRILQMLLQHPPLVPLQQTIPCQQQKRDHKDEDQPNPSSLEEILPERIDNGRVEVVAETEPVLLWDG